MGYKEPKTQKRNLNITDDDWDLLNALGGGSTSAGLRTAATLVRIADSKHGIIPREDESTEPTSSGENHE